MNLQKHGHVLVLSATLMLGILQPLQASQEKQKSGSSNRSYSVLAGSTLLSFGSELNLTPKTQSHYRINPHPRTYGMSQGNVGSCAAEADVTALESAFAYRKLDVRLSSFYRHAYNWRQSLTPKPGTKEGDAMIKMIASTMLDLQEEDRKFLEAIGPIIPDFMLPEDGEGLNPYVTGIRPNPSQIATVPSIWVNATRLGFNERLFNLTFDQKKYSNSADLGTLKALVEKGTAITLTLNLDALLCLKLNERTGDLEKIYRQEKVERCLHGKLSESEPHHAVAVLGFDDSYYQHLGGSGALFIRNSHNDSDAISATNEERQDRPAEKLLNVGKFKQKTLLNENHPGYYAIPYEFLRDSFPMTRFKIIDLDFEAFASMAQRFKPLYQVQYLPFACEVNSGPDQKLSLARTDLQEVMKLEKSPVDQKQLDETWRSILQEESSTRSPTDSTAPRFQFAKLSIGPVGPLSIEADRALEFRRNKFSRYYCPPSSEGSVYVRSVWPNDTFYTELTESETRLSESPYSYSAWEEFLKQLIQLGVPNDYR